MQEKDPSRVGDECQRKTRGRNTGKRAYMEHDKLANKERNTQTSQLHKEGKVNNTQMRPIKEGQTIRKVGKKQSEEV